MANSRGGRRRKGVEARLRAMGLRARPLSGGRAFVAELPLSSEPFQTLEGPRRLESMLFSTVGADRLKCLQPRMLFQLPLLPIGDCESAASVEARIRSAWRAHVAALRRASSWLQQLGIECETSAGGSILTFPIGDEDPNVRATMIEPGKAILPGRGPLSGIRLQRAEDRLLPLDFRYDSSVDLEIAISSQIEELSRLDSRLAEQKREEAIRAATPEVHEAADRSYRVLVIGPRFASDRDCLRKLERLGFRMSVAGSAVDGLRAFEYASPELVLADMSLGRLEAIELIPAIRTIPGIEEVPVVLVDSRKRRERRETCRRIGAAGYLVRPIDVEKIAEGLVSLVTTPRRRRFKRYEHRLSAHYDHAETAAVTQNVGRGGMLLFADGDIPLHSLYHYRLALPEFGETVDVVAEALYRTEMTHSGRTGVGLRFHAFPDDNEFVLISYLRGLEPKPASG